MFEDAVHVILDDENAIIIVEFQVDLDRFAQYYADLPPHRFLIALAEAPEVRYEIALKPWQDHLYANKFVRYWAPLTTDVFHFFHENDWEDTEGGKFRIIIESPPGENEPSAQWQQDCLWVLKKDHIPKDELW